jgi:hypothetical protein
MVIRQVTNLVSTQSEVKKPREGESNSGEILSSSTVTLMTKPAVSVKVRVTTRSYDRESDADNAEGSSLNSKRTDESAAANLGGHTPG